MERKGKIPFRCWYCNRRLSAGPDQVGQRRRCGCGQAYRVPRRPGIAKRDRSVLDWIVEFIVYGGGGAFFGFLIGLALSRFLIWPLRRGMARLVIIAVPMVGGFLIGALFGERGINWIGTHLRNWEERD